MKVFYSWQADLPKATNWSFIEKALERAANEIHTDAELDVEPVIDRDTVGLSGSPNIATAILEKIDSCQAFVCDVSLINSDTCMKPTPNPNVLFELGYAAKHGMESVILVQNTSFGGPEILPFDLRSHRIKEHEERLGVSRSSRGF